MSEQDIILKKIRVHNLKDVDITLERQELVVFTGVSGSGKSSLAFDTLYAEGQRRYVESLSTHARRQMEELQKPDVESVKGLTPTISIEQKTAGRNPRSTVGTMTEIYDYLRVLYARVGIPHCPISGKPVAPQSRERIIKTVQSLPEKTKIIVLAPYARQKKAEFKDAFQELLRKGFMRARVDSAFVDLDDELTLERGIAHDVDVVIDRIVVSPENDSRIAESIITALAMGGNVCIIYFSDTNEEQLFSMHAYSPESGISYKALEPNDFSFNSPSGMCLRCHGLGIAKDFELKKIIDPELSIAQDCCSMATSYQTVRYRNIYDNLASIYGFSVRTPWKKLSAETKEIFLHGTGDDRWIKMHFKNPNTGSTWTDRIKWKGVLFEAHQRYAEAKSDSYRRNMDVLIIEQVCPECKGSRLKPYPSATLLGGKPIQDLTSMTVADSLDFFTVLSLQGNEAVIAKDLIQEIRQRLQFLHDVGLHYLSIDRTAPTLSGGEAQRVRLASQIGCGLVGITYILDEPSIGLHPRDNHKLIRTLQHLRDMGNTVVVVEHDEETMWAADKIVDFGPGPGVNGGKILVNGTLPDLLKTKDSITADYLTGRRFIPIPATRRKPKKESIEIKGAAHNNLKKIDVKIPLGAFICVTGVSGSGKSSLISDILHPALSNILHDAEQPVGSHQGIKGIEHIDKVIAIDQSPIGRNPRSNPATYIKLFDEIRDLFALLPESQARGYKPGRFSFNVKEGSCSRCEGMGMLKIDMDFLEDAWEECPQCHGKRFDQETLSVLYKGLNIFDVLEMDVSEAFEHFQNVPSIQSKLALLIKVGLEYIKLGQSSTTLSGGEAQRIKLAKELVRPSTGNTLYILDEPTTGLHFYDIQHLLNVLHELVDRGNTVLVIEHNMDVVKTADWILDIGPEGGRYGGELVATGTPEKIAKMQTPTGEAIKQALEHDPKARAKEAAKNAKTHAAEQKKRRDNSIKNITVEGAEQNNLKHVDLVIPRNQMTVCTGPSGSGKSSLAFDTIYAEGQRRYIESLSAYARQFVKQMPKPKVTRVEGLSPAVAIEQKSHAGNPRSTIGTMTEIYDYLRVLYARAGIAHCPETGETIKAISKDHVVDRILTMPEGEKIHLLAPLLIRKNDKFEEIVTRFKRQGFIRIRLNNVYYNLDDEEEIPFDRKRKNALFLVVDRLKVDPGIKQRLFEGVENAAKFGDNKVVIATEKEDILYNMSFSVESTGRSYPEITPQTFAFNVPEGMCPSCEGLGVQFGVNFPQKSKHMSYSVIELMQQKWLGGSEMAFEMLHIFLHEEGISPHTPLNEIPMPHLQMIMNGSPEGKRYQYRKGFTFKWFGINHVLTKLARSNKKELRDQLSLLFDEVQCMSCNGARVNALARNVTIDKKPIYYLCQQSIAKTLAFIEALKLNKADEKILEEVKLQIVSRLRFLCEIGLEYISLNRPAPTLSGGEAQRIRLARQLGSGLTGVLYVLDEPTIGLHPRDNDRLNQALNHLKELGNTLILVEHDPLTIANADYILDFGPYAGERGGRVIAQGTVNQIKSNPDSLTGAYLSGKKEIKLDKKSRVLSKGFLSVTHAKVNNLKNISVKFPIGQMSCLSGVSGSGKSSLMHQILEPGIKRSLQSGHDTITYNGAIIEGLSNFDQIICIDQNPIGHTVRSDVGTYVEVLTAMRDFFAQLPDAQIKGLLPKNFSFNHRHGMCSGCQGLGYKSIEMHFLPTVKVVCDDCQGLRLNPLSLQVSYAGKNFGQYLDTTVEDTRVVFAHNRKITRILDTLISVGLGYLKLGQEMVSLSGGEAQRMKLSGELAKRSSGRTLYLLDEPTTGLHFEDIAKLLQVLHSLVEKGNTMIVIEHNVDVIRNADYIVDLGPDAGENGGKLVYQGPVNKIKQCKSSWTGRYL